MAVAVLFAIVSRWGGRGFECSVLLQPGYARVRVRLLFSATACTCGRKPRAHVQRRVHVSGIVHVINIAHVIVGMHVTDRVHVTNVVHVTSVVHVTGVQWRGVRGQGKRGDRSAGAHPPAAARGALASFPRPSDALAAEVPRSRPTATRRCTANADAI
jgi:hypothetical protein